MGERILIHCDLDAFFAAVETLHHDLDPTVPLIIGSDPQNGQGRGIVSTCNYAAREYGVRSAMPISEAWRRCPGQPLGPALYHKGTHRLYRLAARRVMSILSEKADRFEQASIDEAYLDVTRRCRGDWHAAESLARDLQKHIMADISLSASFGIGPTRVAAKMASEARKPGGVFLVPPGGLQEFFSTHPCRAVPGIGPKAAQLLGEMGLMTLEDVYREGPDFLSQSVGERRANSLWRILEGESSSEVSALRSRKSIGKEHTFPRDVEDPSVVMEMLGTLVTRVTKKLQSLEITARNLEIKLRYQGFETLSHAMSLAVSMDDEEVFQRLAPRLLANVYDIDRPVRLIGFRLSDLEAPPNRQATLDRFDH
jgi:DNA polymerase IV (DinB-like DNA polymerase)